MGLERNKNMLFSINTPLKLRIIRMMIENVHLGFTEVLTTYVHVLILDRP